MALILHDLEWVAGGRGRRRKEREKRGGEAWNRALEVALH